MNKISINELRRICQAPRKDKDTWHGRNITRKISIYFTYFFIRLRVSANSITLIFLLVGIIASILMSNRGKIILFISAILFQLWYILDHVDGEVARFQKKTSLTGEYFDHISHYIVHPLFFFFLGMNLYFSKDDVLYIILGFLGAISTMLINVIEDIKNMYFLMRKNDKKNKLPINLDKSFFRRMFSSLHLICTFPVAIDVFLILTIINLAFGINLFGYFLFFYAGCMTFIWVAKFGYIVFSHKMDR